MPEQGYGSSGGTSIPTRRDIAINGVVSTDPERTVPTVKPAAPTASAGLGSIS
jgi:hypothetical protein